MLRELCFWELGNGGRGRNIKKEGKMEGADNRKDEERESDGRVSSMKRMV